jgi:nucleotide-binding universal stress UspA family protein
LILGSISQRVLYEASCSVRIGRDHVQNSGKLLRILIGVDNSPDSNSAVEAVCNRKWPAGTEFGLLVVVDAVMAVPSDSDTLSHVKWIDVSKEENWDQVREIIEPTAQQLRDKGLHAEVLIRRGNPSDQILQEADTWGADCIFVGAKGTRGIPQFQRVHIVLLRL